MIIKPTHNFHIVTQSPWPLTAALGRGILASALVLLFHIPTWHGILSSFIFILIPTSYCWWRDTCREACFQGFHQLKVRQGIELGIMLFILSEVIFFFAFFWAYFHRRLAPNNELGCMWPPLGLLPLDPYRVPLLNTAVLLASGVTVTWAHHGLINKFKCELSWGLGVTIFLGGYFTVLQFGEYQALSYRIGDSVFGASFFVATGFHGLHVIIGTTFLFIAWLRAQLYQFSTNHHSGLELAAWYWHFVDVVWIFLFVNIYWWVI